MVHLSLPAGLAAHQLPGDDYIHDSGGHMITPTGFALAWQLDYGLSICPACLALTRIQLPMTLWGDGLHTGACQAEGLNRG